MADTTQDPTSQPSEAEPTLNGHPPPTTDVEMTDSVAQPPPELPPASSSLPQPDLPPTVAAPQEPPQSAPSHTPTPTPLPAPTSTAPGPGSAPTPSARNSPHPSGAPAQAPTQPIPHGSPTRVYLNQHVTPYLLEAMKHLATSEPDKPLKWLSEFLAQKSAEIEGP